LDNEEKDEKAGSDKANDKEAKDSVQDSSGGKDINKDTDGKNADLKSIDVKIKAAKDPEEKDIDVKESEEKDSNKKDVDEKDSAEMDSDKKDTDDKNSDEKVDDKKMGKTESSDKKNNTAAGKQVKDSKTDKKNDSPLKAEDSEGKKSKNDPGDEVVIEIEHLKKSFGKSEILKDINLTVKRGETIVTLGKSGTGKSVTLKCIVGLIQPDSGKIKVLGKNIPDLSYEALQYMRKKIGFVFQSGALYDSMSVRQNLEFPLMRNTDLSKEEIDSKVEEVLKDVGLSQSIDKMPSELSGGMRKRIGVARTIIMNPEIMLWDEPTTGLDPETTRDISHLIVRMQRKYKVSSIVVTHDMICAKIVANRIAVLKDGEYSDSGTYDELEASSDEFVRSFFDEVKNDEASRLTNYEGDENNKSLKKQTKE
jgi:phospholipid/cholesterol/gamma-HCH transport system ATP-binding protein